MKSIFHPNPIRLGEVSNPDKQPQAAPTAAQVQTQLGGWVDLPDIKRRDLASALKTMVRVSGVPAELLPMTPMWLRTNILRKSAVGWGVKPATRSNLLSHLRRILQRLDVIDSAPKQLTPEWTALRVSIGQRLQMSLSSFMGFCTARNIAPRAVTSQHLADFEDWLHKRTLNANPRAIVTATRRAWSKAQLDIPGWPTTILHLPSLRGQLLLPFSAFPASFQEDVEAYTKRLSGNDIGSLFGVDLDEEAPLSSAGAEPFAHVPGTHFFNDKNKPAFKPMRPTTVVSKLQLLKVSANALHRAGTPLASITSLASLVQPLSHGAAILEHLSQAAGGKTTPQIGQVADLLRQIGKFYTNSSEQDNAQLCKWTKKARVPYTEMTPKNRRLIEEVSPHRQALLNLPDALWQDARAAGPTRRGAILCKQALMVALLTSCPMRLANLQHLRIEQHLLRQDPKTMAFSAILIAQGETKNNVSLTFPLHPRIANLLTSWLQDYRNLLAAPGNPYLFPGSGLNPMTQPGLRDAIKTVTHERLGVAINPHAFRHLAADQFLQQRPGDYENVRRILGHKRLETTTRAYCHGENKAALNLYDEILNNERTGQRRRRKPSHLPGLKPSKAISKLSGAQK